jgi:hypothetical protein
MFLHAPTVIHIRRLLYAIILGRKYSIFDIGLEEMLQPITNETSSRTKRSTGARGTNLPPPFFLTFCLQIYFQ